jgi:hypothetical protein
MTGKSEEDHREVEARNATRAAAGLPLLDAPAEEARLAIARYQAGFERVRPTPT